MAFMGIQKLLKPAFDRQTDGNHQFTSQSCLCHQTKNWNQS